MLANTHKKSIKSSKLQIEKALKPSPPTNQWNFIIKVRIKVRSKYFCSVTFLVLTKFAVDLNNLKKEKMGKTILSVLLLTLLLSPSLCQLAMTWDNWVLPTWKPSWSYNTRWTAPDPATFGYTRYTFEAETDAGYNNRYKHFFFLSNNTPQLGYACGPESYLTLNLLCARNPFYWNVLTFPAACIPDTYYSTVRISCESINPTAECCYKANQGDLRAISRTATTYTPTAKACCVSLIDNMFIPESINTIGIYN